MSNLFKFAENILNNLDQSAQTSIQTALQNKQQQQPSKKSNSDNQYTDSDYPSSRYDTVTNNKQNLRPNSSYSSFTSSTKQKPIKKSKDDELIEFLNSDIDTTTTTTPSNLMTRSMTETKNNYSDSESVIEDTTTTNEINSSDRNSNKSDNEVDFLVGGDSENLEQNDLKLNQILNENKRLKSEIQSLNSEIKSLSNRTRVTDDEFQRTKRKIDHFQGQISESDKIIRELRSREEDMSESIKSKESQIAVLRVKFDEVDKELRSKKGELDILKVESDRLLKEHSNSSDIQSQAFETLKEKINEHEISLQREKEAYLSAQVKFFLCFTSTYERVRLSVRPSVRGVAAKRCVVKG
jgi:peptidoglycan hydrolase CwlO-like protein